MPQQMKLGKAHTVHYTDRNDGFEKVVYHDTEVVAWNAERIILNTGGWRTMTTRTRMNQAANEFGLGFKVYQKHFDWFVQHNGQDFRFQGETVELPRNGGGV